jgi:hypothetical protein
VELTQNTQFTPTALQQELEVSEKLGVTEGTLLD